MERYLLINDTEDFYHWGCYATSKSIKEKIQEKNGTLVGVYTVNQVHAFDSPPEFVSDFSDIDHFKSKHGELADLISKCDTVVINGEGTIHHFGKNPKSILYILFACKKFFGKKVILINHSCFPYSDEADVIDYYKAGYSSCDFVAARESMSVDIIRNKLGVNCLHSFDSLPYQVGKISNDIKKMVDGPYVCISGAVNYDFTKSKDVAYRLMKEYPNHKFIYLAGSKTEGVLSEEFLFFESLKEHIPSLEMIGANSFEEWVSIIKYADLLISGRYHYTICGLCTATPLVYFPSNTPKIEAISKDLHLPKPVVGKNERAFKLKLYISIKLAKFKRWKSLTNKLIVLADNNYKW